MPKRRNVAKTSTQKPITDMFAKKANNDNISKKRRSEINSDVSKTKRTKESHSDSDDNNKENNHQIIKENIGDEQAEISDKKDKSIQDTDNKSEDKVVDVSNSKKINNSMKEELNDMVFRCSQCRQYPNELSIFSGDPDNAVEEFIALANPLFSIFQDGQEGAEDDHPQHRLTNFSVYDNKGHLTPLDSGLLEKNIELFVSGHMKPIYDDCPLPKGGVDVAHIGPIMEWFTAGFDGGSKPLIGITTAYAEYYLMVENIEYSKLMNPLREKIYLSKILIEFLNEDNDQATYEDLLDLMRNTSVPECSKSYHFTEDDLLRHAQWLIDMIQNFDSNADVNDAKLITTGCIRSLIQLAGVNLGNRSNKTRKPHKKKEITLVATVATTTKLIRRIFDSIFEGQLNDQVVARSRSQRCTICEDCQLPDCGSCNYCKDMVKFGGSGKFKKACIKRRCTNMEVKEANDQDGLDEDINQDTEEQISEVKKSKHLHLISKNISLDKSKNVQIECPDEIICRVKNITYYDSLIINGIQISKGNFVSVTPNEPHIPLYIGRIAYFYKKKDNTYMMHINWFLRANDTIMGESGDKQELFEVDDCEDSSVDCIASKINVIHKKSLDNWFKMGGEDDIIQEGVDFYYQKWYDSETARYEDLKINGRFEEKSDSVYCGCCIRIKQYELNELAIMNNDSSSVTFKNNIYKLNDFAYFHCNDFQLKTYAHSTTKIDAFDKSKYEDEDKYPEAYRKNDYVKGSNSEVPAPYCIGQIIKIFVKPNKSKIDDANTKKYDDLLTYYPNSVSITLKKFYRPENIPNHNNYRKLNLNLLFESDEEIILNVSNIRGKCYVVNANLMDKNPEEAFYGTRNIFYYESFYDASSKSFQPSSKLKRDKMDEKLNKSINNIEQLLSNIEKDQKFTKLRSLDVFAGCGGLSEGFHQSGLAETKWAIEKDPSAAHAYRKNNPLTNVFTDDCNELLQLVMDGKTTNSNGQILPQKGDVELLCGGPPCQGFSGMNRFNSREYSKFKNSLIASYLSYCDYYRPRFFILENVRNFVSFKKSMVLKLAIRSLTSIGYQCTFGILQAGNYGVPQTRRRAIIMAAAPGEILPQFPFPLHTFSKRGMHLSVVVDDKKYHMFGDQLNCAPLRTITVSDAMSDLPEISNGASEVEISYGGDAISHFQRNMRKECVNNHLLYDHVCKDMSALVHARMQLVPRYPGADWRDLPNIEMMLSDGTFTKLLRYEYKLNSKDQRRRGVCSCATKLSSTSQNNVTSSKCLPSDRQFCTLIPWCLPHTGNRHNHWAGLYGRLQWDGFFSTTVTNPEPMGKQGRVLHPVQNRVVSVRECARSQGFPDSFRFYGNILDQHRQIGNAVPPPMAKEIGREIKKSVINNMN